MLVDEQEKEAEVKRNVITIDEQKCTGCGLCIPNCPEGAMKIIDGKARLIGDYLCDGLGACLGHCPEGAITIEEREAQPYEERKVMENVLKQGIPVVTAHLEHLRDHGEDAKLGEALAVLKEKGIRNPLERQGQATAAQPGSAHCACPGSASRSFGGVAAEPDCGKGRMPSQLTHWPIQLHLISPRAPHYKNRDVLLAADCVAYTLGGFHNDYLKGKTLAIACPKLDEGQGEYEEKIRTLVEECDIKSLTVMIMEVPCCMGLVKLVERALAGTKRTVPVRRIVVGLQGSIVEDSAIV